MKRGLVALSVSSLLALGLVAVLMGVAGRVVAQGPVIVPSSTRPPAGSPALTEDASIVLTQTVGLDPAICATTDSITLTIGGGTVIYCYRVTNTGDVTLTRHTLVDEHLGTVLSNFPYTLNPGASAYLTQSVVITETTVNSATWTAFNPGPVDEVSDSDGTQVNVALAEPEIMLEKTVGTEPAVCATAESLTLPLGGGSVTYCYRVTNTGDITLTRHTLVDEHLGSLLLDFPYTLAPGASAFLTETTVVSNTTISSATWTAFNPGPVDEASDTDSTAVVIEYEVYLPILRWE